MRLYCAANRKTSGNSFDRFYTALEMRRIIWSHVWAETLVTVPGSGGGIDAAVITRQDRTHRKNPRGSSCLCEGKLPLLREPSPHAQFRARCLFNVFLRSDSVTLLPLIWKIARRTMRFPFCRLAAWHVHISYDVWISWFLWVNNMGTICFWQFTFNCG